MTPAFATWRGRPVLAPLGIPVAALCFTRPDVREDWARPGAPAFTPFWFIYLGRLVLPKDGVIWRPWDGPPTPTATYWLIMYRHDLGLEQSREYAMDVPYPNETDNYWATPREVAKLFVHMGIVP